MRKPEWLRKTEAIFGTQGVEKVAEYCRENWQEDTAHVIRAAEDACENTFLFDFRWDMERTWKPVHFADEIDWNLEPWGDPEFVWQFNRHRFLLCFAQAYRMTGDEKYAVHCVRLIEDWISRNASVEEGAGGPWRTLETGLRAEVWLRSLAEISGSGAVDTGFLRRAEECMKLHRDRLMENFQPHKYISNWGVIEACGLLLFSLVLPDSERCLETAVKRLEDAAAVQVLEDGMQWEQSPMYHNEVYQCYLTALWYGERAGVKLPEVFRDTVRKMAYVDYKWKKPDHTQFAQGDSDTTDLRDMITAGAYLLVDGVLKSGGYSHMDYDNAWKFGWTACMEYEELPSEQPDFISAELPFGGNYYLRSGWTQEDNLLHFHCGHTGGGHGHADKLHVDLVIRGEDVLVDSGRYTYTDCIDRYRLKEAEAHNVVLVDGRGFSECTDSWTYRNLCTCAKQQFFDGKKGAFVEGIHFGFWVRDVVVNRKVIWIKPDIYIIADRFLAHWDHTYESLFHFSGHGTTELLDNGMIHFTGDRAEAYVQFAGPEEEGTLEDTEQSSFYNEKHPNKTYRGRFQGAEYCGRIAVINGGEKGSTDPVRIETVRLYSEVEQDYLDPQKAEGLRIIDGEKEYVLFLCYQEVMTPTDILRWENCLGHGNAVLFDRSEEKEQVITGEILSW